MSEKERDQSGDGDDRERESRRDRRRRQRDAVKRQKALVASERARRKEREKAERREPQAGAVKPKPDEDTAKTEKPRRDRSKPRARAAEKAEPAKPKAEPAEPRLKRRRRERRGAGAKRVGAGARRFGSGARKAGAGVGGVGVELLKLGREMLVIPLQLWLGLAEIIGRFVLAVWLRIVVPLLRMLKRFALALLHFGERHITPARALTVVALVAIGALVAAQWRDYSAVSVGVDAYSGDVGAVAPPPEVSSAPTHDAHGWVMLIIAALSVLALLGAVAKRRRLAIWLVPLGIAVLAISLGIDAPKGLDEGEAAVAYESASASLLSGFWLQIAAGAVLIICGLMLPRALHPAGSSVPAGKPGPSLIDQLVARVRRTLERRRARPRGERGKRRLPKLRRPSTKGKVQGART
jgi:hypothetical protein